jgi:hypothetical protein
MDKNKINKIYQKAIDRLNNAPNNTLLRLKTERDLKNMKKDFKLGLITEDELFDLEWFYFETWIDPIQQIGPCHTIFLN